VGAYLPVGQWVIGVAVGAGTAVLLQFKPELHGIAVWLGDKDMRAIMQFVLITCVILPVLPNQAYGPLEVFNPFEAWLMVVLIVGISLGGYLLYRLFGSSAGVLLGGMLGGAISSTATTVSYARRAARQRKAVPPAAAAIMVASAVVYVRVLIEVAVVAPKLLTEVVGPVLLMMLVTLLPAVLLWVWFRKERATMPQQENPTQIRSAIAFGLMYAIVLVALAAVKQYFSDRELFVVAGLSGLTDMDALTLSTARMVKADQLVAAQAWRLVVVGLMSNLIFKGAIVAWLGHPRLFKFIVLLFAVPVTAGLALLLFWPETDTILSWMRTTL
jgi:uncharacterized membrane protein (DUF4010 family)